MSVEIPEFIRPVRAPRAPSTSVTVIDLPFANRTPSTRAARLRVALAAVVAALR